MAPSSPELDLLLCAASPRPDEARLAAVLRTAVDWDRFLELAELNRIVPAVHWSLSRSPRDGVPGRVARLLAERFESNLEWNRKRAAELERIARALDREGVPYLSLKGPVLAEQYYGHLGLRMFWDLDLLVRRDDLDRAFEALRALGFEPEPDRTPRERACYERYHFAYYFFRGEAPRLEVDLHWSYLPRTWTIPMDVEGMWARAETVRVGETPVRTLTAEDLLFYLAVHGTKESWARLRMVADVAAVVAARADLDLEGLLARARKQGGGRMLLLALFLAAERLGAAVPGPVLASARADPVVVGVERERRQVLAEGRIRRHHVFSVTGYGWRILERPADRVRYVWRTMVTPRLRHQELVRLPRSLAFLYVPLKLVHDYLLAPAWGLLKGARPRDPG